MENQESKNSSPESKTKPEKKLTRPLKKKGGRGSSGRITVRHRGGGAKRKYRVISFGQEKLGETAKVVSIEYDPNRTANIAKISYPDGQKKYIIAPHKLKVGDKITMAPKAPVSQGNRMKLKNIPVGTMVHNIELEPQKGGKMARGAGTGAQVLAHKGKYCHLKMPSTEIRKVPQECFASIGIVSAPEHRFSKAGKAGKSRKKGKRPAVRGTAMSAADHPHGGGEGRTPVGRKYSKTPWGKPAHGVKTRKKGKWTDKFILKPRKKKRKK